MCSPGIRVLYVVDQSGMWECHNQQLMARTSVQRIALGKLVWREDRACQTSIEKFALISGLVLTTWYRPPHSCQASTTINSSLRGGPRLISRNSHLLRGFLSRTLPVFTGCSFLSRRLSAMYTTGERLPSSQQRSWCVL